MLIGIRNYSGIALLLWCLSLQAEEIHLAVATNFSKPARLLAAAFEHQSGHRSIISTGSTGKLYAQIINGAPYDIFLAADNRRPALLEASGIALPGSRYTYALGKLAVWSRDPGYVPANGMPDTQSFARLALANPQLAPYGAAAREVLQNLELWAAVETRIVRGESIGQAFQFVASGNARLGFIAQSQLPPEQGSAWLVPDKLHKPIQQQVVLLTDSPATRDFLRFLQQDAAQSLILQNGYGIADNK